MKISKIKILKNENSKYYILLALLTTLMRLPYFLAKYTLGVDDGIYAMSAKHVAKGSIPFREVFSSQGAWFIDIIALPMRIFGYSHQASRVIPVLAGIVIVITSFKIAKRYMSPNIAFFCALTVGLSGTLSRTTSAITSDGLVIAFALLCILYSFKLVENPTMLNTALLGIFLGLGCSVKSIFMVPTIIFIIYSTYRVSYNKRIIAGIISIVFFVIPFLVYGFKNVWNQSIAYHLEKDESLSVASNLKKMLTTFTSLDILAVVLVLALLALIFLNKSKAPNINIKSKYLLYAFIIQVLSTFLLLTIQSPLFRNHLAILVPTSIILIFIFIQPIFNMRNLSNALIITLLLLSSIYTSINLINDNQFGTNKNSTNYQTILSKFQQSKNSMLITNDVGLAFDAEMDVPLGLEDTSKYRFISKNKNLKINSKTFAKYIDDKKTCSIALDTTSKGRTFKIESKLGSDWRMVNDKFGYKIWVNKKRCS